MLIVLSAVHFGMIWRCGLQSLKTLGSVCLPHDAMLRRAGRPLRMRLQCPIFG